MPLDPVTVWIVPAGERDAARASLSIDERAVVFRREEEDPLRLTARRIRDVRRQLGSPVLLLDYLDDDGEERRLLVFFTPPPPLPEPGNATLLRPRGLERTAGALTLRRANRRLKPVVREWANALESLRRSP